MRGFCRQSECYTGCMFTDISLVDLVIFVGVLFVSMSVHEMMHAFTAFKLGDDLAHSRGRISLNPLNHIDPLFTIALPAMILFLNQIDGINLPLILAAKPVPINTNRISGDEMGLAAVGIAGPITNLALASIGALFFNVAGLDPGLFRDIVVIFIQLNVALFVFNMLPIPPLDGSRILYAVAPPPVQRVMEQIESMGLMGLIIILYILSPILGPIISDGNRIVLDVLIR